MRRDRVPWAEWVGALCLLTTLTACGSTVRPGPAAAWAEGPVRWLLLPDEARRFRRLEDGRDAVQFIEQFWRRRDPDPSDSGNPCLETFHERVQAADQLYSSRGIRGSLTDRGRALILLGPPPILRYGYRKPVSTGAEDFGLVRTQPADPRALETWEYPEAALAPHLLELLDAELLPREVVLRFEEGPRRTKLVSDPRVLELAARVLVER